MRKPKLPLYLQIIAGMLIGVAIGFAGIWLDMEEFISNWIEPFGKLFIKALILIAVPLVFITLTKGIADLKGTASLSRLGGKTIAIYLATTVFAVLVGLSSAMILRPGKLISNELIELVSDKYADKAHDIELKQLDSADNGPLGFLDQIIPGNIFQAMSSNSNMLQIIFFAILFGVAILSIPDTKKQALLTVIDALNDAVMNIVGYIIKCAPIGVAALMAGMVVDFNGDAMIFAALGAYAANVIIGLLLLLLVFYPLLAQLFSKIHYVSFLRKVYPLQLFAFTTSSSAATLPMTFSTAREKLGVSEEVSSFVLPIGTTINMDGTSCYQTIATIFIAQALGIELTLVQILTIILMTTLSSIGTPAIPGGSYVILAMVLTSVGIPAESLALIIGIDRPLDMLRTSVNVTGDVTVAAIIDKSTK